jgi:hypothetical protein
LICIAAPKDFEEGFQPRVAEEAITPQIVSIFIVTWVTSFRQASSSRPNGEGSGFGPVPPLPLAFMMASTLSPSPARYPSRAHCPRVHLLATAITDQSFEVSCDSTLALVLAGAPQRNSVMTQRAKHGDRVLPNDFT